MYECTHESDVMCTMHTVLLFAVVFTVGVGTLARVPLSSSQQRYSMHQTRSFAHGTLATHRQPSLNTTSVAKPMVAGKHNQGIARCKISQTNRTSRTTDFIFRAQQLIAPRKQATQSRHPRCHALQVGYNESQFLLLAHSSSLQRLRSAPDAHAVFSGRQLTPLDTAASKVVRFGGGVSSGRRLGGE